MQPNSFLYFPDRHFETQDLKTACVLKYLGFNLFAISQDTKNTSIDHFVFTRKNDIDETVAKYTNGHIAIDVECLRKIARDLIVRVKKS